MGAGVCGFGCTSLYRMSASVTMPTSSWSAATMGIPLIRLTVIRATRSLTRAPGRAAMTGEVMMSLANSCIFRPLDHSPTVTIPLPPQEVLVICSP